MFPMWTYLAVAAVIAVLAFAIGQIGPGLGVTFVALASTMWTAHAVHRGRMSRS